MTRPIGSVVSSRDSLPRLLIATTVEAYQNYARVCTGMWWPDGIVAPADSVPPRSSLSSVQASTPCALPRSGAWSRRCGRCFASSTRPAERAARSSRPCRRWRRGPGRRCLCLFPPELPPDSTRVVTRRRSPGHGDLDRADAARAARWRDCGADPRRHRLEGHGLCITGKGGHVGRLPLPADVGGALASYLHDGRPRRATGRCS